MENDYQPEEIDDETVEDISNADYLYPKDIKKVNLLKQWKHTRQMLE